MLTQTLALIIDSYRELSAKKIFWLSMGVSGLIVLIISAVGFSENGNMSLLWYETALPLEDMGMQKDVFYKMVFVNIGFKFWLAWGATILALASTAGVFPDFISGGAIDLALSKPIGRVRLLLTKYLASLLFVALQVAVFSLCAFLVIGLRGGSWEPAVFFAVPLVTLFYSYLYSVCALCGILTRSAITSLIITGIFWFVVFVVGSAESVMLAFRTQQDVRVHSYETSIAALENRAPADAPGEPANSIDRIKEYRDEQVAEKQLQRAQANLEEARADAEGIALYHRIAFGVKTFLPKTAETLDILEYRLVSMDDVSRLMLSDQGDPHAVAPLLSEDGELSKEMRDAQKDLSTIEMQSRVRNRSLWWVLGTSLLFEAGVLGIAAWRFKRRDF